MEVTVNYVAVLVAAIAAFAVGMLWYTVLFQKPWAKEMGFDMEKMKNDKAAAAAAGKSYMISAALGLLTGYMMAHVMALSINTFHYSPIMTGISTGFFMWLGFVLPVQATDSMFSGKSTTLLAINTGYQLVSMIVMGIVIGLFPIA